MITLSLHQPHWIKDEGDDPNDQCAHGYVEFSVNGETLVDVDDGEWTVSAAALFLLRTATQNHSPNDSVAEGNFLIPCCGFNIWPSEKSKFPFFIPGCNIGIDPKIEHIDREVHITLDDRSVSVPELEWIRAVVSFAEQVEAFYSSSEKKVELEDDFDREGWNFFWSDFAQQKKRAEEILRR